MEVHLGNHKYFTVIVHMEGYKIVLAEEKPNGKRIQLNRTQAKTLMDSLQTIDTEAEAVWAALPPDAVQEFRRHLGYGVYLTVKVYNNQRYYDIRKWWIPPTCKDAVPTKIGLNLTTDQCSKLRDSRQKLLETAPQLEGIGPCECWLSAEEFSFINCRRCNPWNSW